MPSSDLVTGVIDATGVTRRGRARDAVALARTWLFVPGTGGARLQKAYDSRADEVVLDLEDAVPPGDKEAARAAVVAWLGTGGSAWVRVNGAATPWHADDVAAVAGCPGLRGLVVPKCELPAVVSGLRKSLPDEVGLVGLVETALGIRDVQAIASAGVDRLAFGSLDFAADVDCSPEDDLLLHARAVLVIASRCASLPAPVDGVTPALDVDRVAEDARRARSAGFRGKLCIHPAQLEPADTALRPTVEEVAWARRVLAAASGGGVALVDGAMVDAPVVDRARRIVG